MKFCLYRVGERYLAIPLRFFAVARIKMRIMEINFNDPGNCWSRRSDFSIFDLMRGGGGAQSSKIMKNDHFVIHHFGAVMAMNSRDLKRIVAWVNMSYWLTLNFGRA